MDTVKQQKIDLHCAQWQDFRFNKLVASYRRCVCLIINQCVFFFSSREEHSCNLPANRWHIHSISKPLLICTLRLYDVQEKKCLEMVLDFHSLVMRKKYRYVILVQKRTQENEITKRWFIVFYEIKNLLSIQFVIHVIIYCIYFIIYFSHRLRFKFLRQS